MALEAKDFWASAENVTRAKPQDVQYPWGRSRGIKKPRSRGKMAAQARRELRAAKSPAKAAMRVAGWEKIGGSWKKVA